MKSSKFIFILIYLFLNSCKREHFKTKKLCEENIYLEIYEGYFDEYEYYLTDSATYDIHIGHADIINVKYIYECKNDSLYFNLYHNEYDSIDVSEQQVFSLDDLTINKKK